MAQDRNINPPRQDRNPLPTHREMRIAIYIYAALIVIGVVVVILLYPWIETWEPVASDRAADELLDADCLYGNCCAGLHVRDGVWLLQPSLFRNRLFAQRPALPTRGRTLPCCRSQHHNLPGLV